MKLETFKKKMVAKITILDPYIDDVIQFDKYFNLILGWIYDQGCEIVKTKKK